MRVITTPDHHPSEYPLDIRHPASGFLRRLWTDRQPNIRALNPACSADAAFATSVQNILLRPNSSCLAAASGPNDAAKLSRLRGKCRQVFSSKRRSPVGPILAVGSGASFFFLLSIFPDPMCPDKA